MAHHRPVDRTAQAVRRQLAAYGCPRYEIGIRDREGRMLMREWDAGEIMRALPWLRRQNASGADIYIRPHPSSSRRYALIDDIDQATAEQIAEDGVPVALVVETSPGNNQAWIRLPDGTARHEHTAAARLLAERYGGDMASADCCMKCCIYYVNPFHTPFHTCFIPRFMSRIKI